jgi:rhamnogalacturonyl hydrolase YesR
VIDRIRLAAAHLLAYPFRVWGFGEGIGVRALLKASAVTGDPQYEGFVRGLFSAWLGRGSAKSFEDHVAPGYELLALHERTGDGALLDAAHRLAALHSRFEVLDGIRLHRPDQPGWKRQIWVDCMHVDGPFLARLGLFDEAVDRVLSYASVLQEPGGLFRHGWEADCGRNGELWARGNGWALTGMLDTLAAVPREHPRRSEIRDRVLRLLQALASYQTSGGLWHTVITDETTYPETTLAAMMAVALRDAERANAIDTGPFHKMRVAAEEGVLGNVNENGELGLTTEATPIGEQRMYATRRFGVFPWGQGPLVLLLCQRELSRGREGGDRKNK